MKITGQLEMFDGRGGGTGRGRPRKRGRVVRMYFAGYLHPDEDEDDRRLFEWYANLPEGTRFAAMKAALLAGEGVAGGQAAGLEEAAAMEAVEGILDNFVV